VCSLHSTVPLRPALYTIHYTLYTIHYTLYTPLCSVRGDGAAVASGHGGTGSAVQELDWSVGIIMAALKTSGADNNTVVFFTRCSLYYIFYCTLFYFYLFACCWFVNKNKLLSSPTLSPTLVAYSVAYSHRLLSSPRFHLHCLLMQ
jgi:hypothetical protein